LDSEDLVLAIRSGSVMSTKFGTSRFGTSVFSEVPDQSGVVVQPESYTPKHSKFFTPKMAKEIRRRHNMAVKNWGTEYVLYSRKLNGEHLTFKISEFDTTSPYSKTIWTRGVGRNANFGHPNTQKLVVKANGLFLSQVNDEKALFGTFSFYIKVMQDKSIVLLFSPNFDPTGKLIVVEYDSICHCTDPVSMQSSNPRCPLCFGTTFEGGYDRYYNPEHPFGYVSIRKRFSARAQQLKEQGFAVSNQAEFWTIPEPGMKDKDIVEQVDGNEKSKRFFITNWNMHNVGVHDTSQVFQMTELTSTDPAYAMSFL